MRAPQHRIADGATHQAMSATGGRSNPISSTPVNKTDVSRMLIARCIALLIAALALGCQRSAATSCVPDAAFPQPRFNETDGVIARPRSACVDTADLALDATTQHALDGAIAQLITDSGLSRSGDRSCDWSLQFTHDSVPLDVGAAAVWSTTPTTERWAAETVVIDDHEAATTIQAADARTALDALRVLLASSSGGAAEGTIVDGPIFPVRGVIEGSYAAPMDVDDRSTTIALVGRLRGNAYLYAPKTDLYANEKWAEPYPNDKLRPIAQAATQANQDFVDFYWAVSPGWRDSSSASIQYGSDDDFARLTSKVDQLRAAGVNRFALFLDDINTDFAWSADAATFDSLAAAHAFLANRLEAYVATVAGTDLWFVGTHYSADDEWLDYNAALGASLDPRVTVFWTGDSVYSRTITAADLTPINAALQRHVAIWDNSPYHVLPLAGRGSDLANAASAYLANTVLTEAGEPMQDYWAVLGTIADFAWAPDRYSPTTSMDQWARVRPCVVSQSDGR
jgi:hypothetical protein